jgi:hypothetical protein
VPILYWLILTTNLGGWGDPLLEMRKLRDKITCLTKVIQPMTGRVQICSQDSFNYRPKRTDGLVVIVHRRTANICRELFCDKLVLSIHTC